ncbi:MAG TPA: thiamine pyrophosphate-binding protein [Candidatus Sulfotelmatobacter sp.]|nr:thiamine pyrophosphate-binding protein [Candidatus Sulfotelmatobacter sp.]
MSTGMRGAEALLSALTSMGVARIYASPGSDWAPLWEALAGPAARDFPRYISSRHEETAVAMAMGYAKATNRLAAVVLHTTVGALHAGMLLRAALHERIPLVVLAGESIGFGEAGSLAVGRQWLRLLTDTGGPARLMETCVKWSFGLNTAVILPQTIQRACQIAAAAPQGPVLVSVPLEHLIEPMPAAPPPASLPLPAVAGDDAIERLATALNAARNPVIVTEEAGRDPAALPALVAIAETLGAPVLEAWQPYYVNFPRRHPLAGGVAYDDMPALLADADTVFLVEAVLPWHPPSRVTDKTVLVLGEEPLHVRLPFWGFRADVIAAGAAAPSLRALHRKLAKKTPRHDWPGRLAARRAGLIEAGRAAGDKPAIESAWVGHALNQALPADAIVVNETITHRLALHQQLERLGPGGFYEASYGGLGGGIGLALGVKSAHPERTVVLTIGDGAFHYNPVVASFGAAQEHGLPIFVIVFNNAGYLSQKSDVLNSFPEGEAARAGQVIGTTIAPPPDYSLLARAYGGVGERVDQPAALAAALARGLAAVARGQLALLDVVLKPI